jgi:hypothetical protein
MNTQESRKSWSLTALAAEFDLPFKTAMSYRKGYCRIDPDVKVPGVAKKQFSPRQVAKFLVARRLFKAQIVGSVVQKFFSEVMDEYDRRGDLFEESEFKDFHPPADLVTEEKITDFYRQKLPEEEAVCRAKMTFLKMKIAVLNEELLQVSWLVAYDPANPTKTAAFICSSCQALEKRIELVDSLRAAKWQWSWICLGVVKDELWGRVESNYKCVEYKPKSPKSLIAEALAALRKEPVGQ